MNDGESDFIGILKKYSSSYGKELEAKKARLDELIGEAHWLSVGNYKESLLRRHLQDKIPRKFEVGTGFVLAREGNKRILSNQIDILIWDSFEHSPFFRDDDFVIIPPEACRAAIEVKGTLDHEQFKAALENLDSLSQFRLLLGNQFKISRQIFGYSKDSKIKFPYSLWNTIYNYYKKNDLISLEERISWMNVAGETWYTPWINTVAVLGHGVIVLQELTINDQRHAAFTAYKTETDNLNDTYGFIEKRILLHLAGNSSDAMFQVERPGATSVLFANRSEFTDHKSFMLIPSLTKPIEKIRGLNNDKIPKISERIHTVRKR